VFKIRKVTTSFKYHLCIQLVLLSLIISPVYAERNISIIVKENEIWINGKYLKKESTLTDFTKILGDPDRVAKRKNVIYTYDDLGILLYQRPSSNVIRGISIVFGGQRFEFSPQASFRSRLFIGGDEVKKEYSKDAIFLNKGIQPTDYSRKYQHSSIKAYAGNIAILFNYAFAGDSQNIFVKDTVIDTIYLYRE